MKPIHALRMRTATASSGPIDGTLGTTDAGILAAVYFTVSGSTVTVVGQKNVSSVTRQAAGVYRITFTSALANTNYGIMLSGRRPNDTIGDMPLLVQPNRDSTSGNNTYSTTSVDVVGQIGNGGGTASEALSVGAVIYDPSAVSSSNYGAAASWTVSGTTVTLQRALNVSSMTREAAGVYRTNFTSALPNANYSEFAASRFGDFANIASPLSGQNRNTTIPSNLHSTSALDLCTGRANAATGGGNFDTARGSVLVGESNVAPRGTIARVRFSMSGGVATIVESYNVGSITVQGAGIYRINFASPCTDSNYAVFGSGKWGNSTDDDTPIIGANCNSVSSRTFYSASGVDIVAHTYTSSGIFDPDFVNVWVLKPWLM